MEDQWSGSETESIDSEEDKSTKRAGKSVGINEYGNNICICSLYCEGSIFVLSFCQITFILFLMF